MSLRKRILLYLLLIFLLIILINLRARHALVNGQPGWIDRAVGALYTPVAFVTERSGGILSGFWNDYVALMGVKRENGELKKQLAAKESLILSLQERLKAGEASSKALALAEGLHLEGLSARIVAYDAYASSQTMWLSKGSEAGVAMDSPVISEHGLVGRVVRVMPRSAQVLLLVDSHFFVDAMNVETRVRAIVQGSGRDDARLKRTPLMSHVEYFHIGQPFKKDDLLVTSGLGGLYPPGLPVGTVVDIKRDEDSFLNSSTVLPKVDFSTLEEVVILPPAIHEFMEAPAGAAKEGA